MTISDSIGIGACLAALALALVATTGPASADTEAYVEGTQTAAHKVRSEGSDVPLAGSAGTLQTCYPNALCIYQYPRMQGEMLALSNCGVQYPVPDHWSGPGSHVNNQPPGTRGAFYNAILQVVAISCASLCTVPNSPDWSIVRHASAC